VKEKERVKHAQEREDGVKGDGMDSRVGGGESSLSLCGRQRTRSRMSMCLHVLDILIFLTVTILPPENVCVFVCLCLYGCARESMREKEM